MGTVCRRELEAFSTESPSRLRGADAMAGCWLASQPLTWESRKVQREWGMLPGPVPGSVRPWLAGWELLPTDGVWATLPGTGPL